MTLKVVPTALSDSKNFNNPGMSFHAMGLQ